MQVTASYQENVFSDQFKSHHFSCALQQEAKPNEDVGALHAALTQMCRQNVRAQIVKFMAEVEARRQAGVDSAVAF